MGVPALFRWLSKKYPKIISPVIEEQPQQIDDETIPIDITKANPNGFEYDNLYLDMNGIVHPCSHPEDRPAPETEEDMMVAIFEYTERVVNMVRPRKLLMMAVDGVAPRAKMNQQRSRRFRAAKEAKEKDEDNAALLKLLKQQGGGEVADGVQERMTKKTWDSNSITPGTPFMRLLAKSLNYWVAYKQTTDPAWRKFKVIISTAAVPGEGEHKIMNFVRSQRISPEHDPNTRHVIYGLDADLIMLGLVTHEPRFHVLREDVFAQENKPRTCRICGQPGHFADECRGEAKKKEGEFDEKERGLEKKPYIWLNVGVLREYLECELHVPNMPFKFDLERALDDWVTMCYFVGNDFLPHLPSLEIREDGIDTLIAIWRDTMLTAKDYLTCDGTLNLEVLQPIMAGLAKQEDGIFKRRQQTEERKEAAQKRRKLEQDRRNNARNGGNKEPAYANVDSVDLFNPSEGQRPEAKLTHQMIMNRGEAFRAANANKSAAAVLKSQLLTGGGGAESNGRPQGETEASASQGTQDGAQDQNGAEGNSGVVPASALGKRKADLMDEDEPSTPGRNTPVGTDEQAEPKKDEPPPDTVRLWEDGYADRYYEQKFLADPKDTEFRSKVAAAYAEGLQWVLLYYLQGCPSWTWYYPYHYAPFAADFVNVKDLQIKFDKGRIFKPYEQLMGVMPVASNHTIPEVFHSLMTDEESGISHFYPEDFPIDLNGKKFAWQGVALLPFIDEKLLLDAMATKYPLLSADEHARNDFGKDTLLFSENNSMYDDIGTQFFSKRPGEPTMKLNQRKTDGLAGLIEKDPEHLRGGPLEWPFESNAMPDEPQNLSVSVLYDMPKSKHVHKSMLLRGAKVDPPLLNGEDKRMTAERAAHTGRGYGGNNNFNRNNGGRGRGGRGGGGGWGDRGGNDRRSSGGGGYQGGNNNYQPDPHRPRDEWRNPIAPHLAAGYTQLPPGPPPPGQHGYYPPVPPPQFGAFGGPPPPPPTRGYPQQHMPPMHQGGGYPPYGSNGGGGGGGGNRNYGGGGHHGGGHRGGGGYGGGGHNGGGYNGGGGQHGGGGGYGGGGRDGRRGGHNDNYGNRNGYGRR